MPLTPEQRSLRASLAAHSLHAQGKTNTEPARRAFMQRFEDAVDPDGILSPELRAKRAHHALTAHMKRLALKRSLRGAGNDGVAQSAKGEGPDGEDWSESLGLAKANVSEFMVSEDGARLVERRTKAHIAERGWLMKQYEAAIAGFRREEAIVLGAGTSDAVTRPDQDPNTVAVYDLEARAEKTSRWRWAEQLFSGRYDDPLSRSLDVAGDDDPFSSILADASNFERAGTDDAKQSLLDYLNEIVPVDPTIDARYFDPLHLAGGGVERDWRPRVWWPDQLENSKPSTAEDSIPTVGSIARGRAWIAVRADMSADMQPAALFGEVQEAPAEVEVSGPDF